MRVRTKRSPQVTRTLGGLRKEIVMLWLYIVVPLIVLCGAAGVINRRRRRSFSYDSESAAQVARGRAESKLPGH